MTSRTNQDLPSSIINNSYEDVVKHLNSGAGPDDMDASSRRMLHLAIMSSASKNIINELLYGNPNMELKTFGLTPFLTACAYSNSSDTDLLRSLIERGANPMDRDEYGRNAIHLAASSGNAGAIAFLYMIGVDINAKDSVGKTPLTIALLSNNIDASKTLIGLGAETPDIKKTYPDQYQKLKPQIELRKIKDGIVFSKKNKGSTESLSL